MSFSSSSVQDRIKEQTSENLRLRAEQKLADAEHMLSMERAGRQQELVEVDELFQAILGKVDVLLEFIVQRCGELPPELLELIAERQEQRIEATLPGGIDLTDTDAETGLLPQANLSIGVVAGSIIGRSAAGQDGQILRRAGDTVEWTDPDGFKTKSLTTIRKEVQRLLSTLKDK